VLQLLRFGQKARRSRSRERGTLSQ
jgi:hypothetical protein